MYKLTFFLSTRGRGPVIVPPFGVSCLLVFSAAPRLRPAFGLLPRPRGGRGSIGDTPREGGDEPPLRGTVDHSSPRRIFFTAADMVSAEGAREHTRFLILQAYPRTHQTRARSRAAG